MSAARLSFSALAVASAAIVIPSLPSVARAGDGQSYEAPARNVPQDATVAVELRFGAYTPQVDRQFSGRTPFKDTFGDDTRFMIGGEVDWQPIHIPHVGSVGLGGLVGYTSASANAQFADGTGASDEETSFNVWMLAALAVVRIDVLARETWIPLVPYAKFGPAVGLWSSSDGRGTSRSADGLVARGRTNGFFYAFGGMLLLDALDRQAAKTFAAERGVLHTYAFAEYTIADLSGVGQQNAMQVGDTTWTVGLAFEL